MFACPPPTIPLFSRQSYVCLSFFNGTLHLKRDAYLSMGADIYMNEGTVPVSISLRKMMAPPQHPLISYTSLGRNGSSM